MWRKLLAYITGRRKLEFENQSAFGANTHVIIQRYMIPALEIHAYYHCVVTHYISELINISTGLSNRYMMNNYNIHYRRCFAVLHDVASSLIGGISSQISLVYANTIMLLYFPVKVA